MTAKQLIPDWTIRPEEIETFEALLEEWRRTVRAMPGCLSFRILRDVEDRRRFTFLEEWTDQEAFDRYVTSPELQAFLDAGEPLTATPPCARLVTVERERAII